MTFIAITIPGRPVAKGRPRLSNVNGCARAFTPAKTRRYEDLIRLEAGRLMEGREMMTGAVSATVRAFVAIPKSMSKQRRLDAIEGRLRPTTRPDIDNYVKTLDALNDIVFHDDSQIAQLIATKHYSDRPRLEIELRGME